jgi:hypothetical protein
MESPLADTVISSLDRTDAKTFVVVTIGDPFVPAVDTDSWPVPSFAALRGTRLGAQPVGQGSLMRVTVRDGRFVPIPREQWDDLPLEQQFDAVLYLGPPSTRTAITRSKAVCDEPGYVDTRLKRIALAGLPPSVAKEVREFCAKSLWARRSGASDRNPGDGQLVLAPLEGMRNACGIALAAGPPEVSACGSSFSYLCPPLSELGCRAPPGRLPIR